MKYLFLLLLTSCSYGITKNTYNNPIYECFLDNYKFRVKIYAPNREYAENQIRLIADRNGFKNYSVNCIDKGE